MSIDREYRGEHAKSTGAQVQRASMPGRTTLVQQEQHFGGAAVQARAAGEGGAAAGPRAVQDLASEGVAGSGGPLPFGREIQRSFGRHDLSAVQAFVGGAAAEASRGIGAQAYATGSKVAFRDSPDLFTAAHEAAHVVQQRAGVQLKGGVGEVGDRYEQHADAVAAQVVRGESAEGLLDEMAGGGAGGGAVQRVADGPAEGAGADAGDPEALRAEAIGIIEAALDVAHGADAGADGDGAGATPASAGAEDAAPQSQPPQPQPQPFTPEQVAHLQEALANLHAMQGQPADEVRAAARPIIDAARGRAAPPAAGDAQSGAQAPVQRAAIAAALPAAAAAGPPGWVVLAVAVVVVGGIVIAQAARNRDRARDRDRAEPRVGPRTGEPPVHMGNIHVQGDDIGSSVPNYPWNQPTPCTKAQALAALAALRAQLSTRQVSCRETAFIRAAAFINATMHSAPPPLFRTFQDPNVIDDDRYGTRRVDIEIIRGQAFV